VKRRVNEVSVLMLDYKLRVTPAQQAKIDEAIRTAQFIRNKALRFWADGRGVGDNDLQVYCAELAHQYAFAACLNSQARQASADRAWLAIARFTTQDCSGCGYRVKKSLSMRTHVCPSCGLVLDRDQNAARNILDSALRTAGQAGTGSGSPGQNASGQIASTAVFARARRKRAG
jgi:transposase